MNRDQKINLLLERRGVEDERRLALDALDLTARQTSSWGSKEHRDGRDRTERTYDSARRTCSELSEEALDQAIAALAGV